jgi:hypothetical protein
MRQVFLIACLSFLFSLFLVRPVWALETTLNPVRDTYVIPEGSSISHGFEPTLLIENGIDNGVSYRSYAFLIFEVESLAEAAIIDQATLSLTLTQDISDTCSVQVQRQNEPWNENENYFSLGYVNTGTIYDIAYIVEPKEYTWDITQLAKKWKSREFANNGVVMFATDECKKYFASRDNENSSLRPKLTISYHLPPTPTPTPTPTVTPRPTKRPSPTLTPALTASPTEMPTPTPTLPPTSFFGRQKKTIFATVLIAGGSLSLITALFLGNKQKKSLKELLFGTIKREDNNENNQETEEETPPQVR